MYTDDRFIDMWETLVDELGLFTDEELGLATALCGRSVQTLESALYVRTGYHSLDQLEADELLREDEE